MAGDEKKMMSVDDLAQLLADRRAASEASPPKVVHCHGVFDLLHIGHIRYLQAAARLGDVLVVTVTPDRFVNKGPHRPAFQEQLRLDALAALDCVDFVALNEWPVASEAIRRLRPDIYAKGAEFREQKTPELLEEESLAAELGVQVEFIEAITSSSSRLINEYLTPFDEETQRYLRDFRARNSMDDVLHWVAKARDLRVLVVGEAIIDEYYGCAAIGRSAKAPILATRYESHQRFAGGAVAVANHLAPFCRQVGLLSMLGDQNSEEDWIRSQLAAGVEARFIVKSDSPTIIKRRYRETYFGVPLFAINFLSDEPLGEAEEAELCELLASSAAGYDLVLVVDYGHEMMSEAAVAAACENAPFLAVNTQANAANTGFHTISKYPRADYVSLAERELQLECRSRSAPISQMLVDVGQRLYAGIIVVTLGKRGCIGYHRRSGHQQAPSLATQVVDRVGAGDAFFAMTALAAAVDAPLDILTFLGNVAGAEAVAVVGNSHTMDEQSFHRHIQSLFK